MPVVKRLPRIVEALVKTYEADGKKAELTDLRDPFQLGAWFILGQHARRNGQARAYDALRRAKGLTPGRLLDLPEVKLAAIAQAAGPYDDARAKDLYAFADQVEDKCGHGFDKILKSPAEARKVLENDLKRPREFVDFLLLYGGRFPIFPIDLRVARVAVRLGLAKSKSEKTLDEKTYKDLQKTLESEAGKDPEALIRAHSVLVRHANDVCHAMAPACGQCALAAECAYLKKHPLPPKVPPPQA